MRIAVATWKLPRKNYSVRSQAGIIAVACEVKRLRFEMCCKGFGPVKSKRTAAATK